MRSRVRITLRERAILLLGSIDLLPERGVLGGNGVIAASKQRGLLEMMFLHCRPFLKERKNMIIRTVHDFLTDTFDGTHYLQNHYYWSYFSEHVAAKSETNYCVYWYKMLDLYVIYKIEHGKWKVLFKGRVLSDSEMELILNRVGIIFTLT